MNPRVMFEGNLTADPEVRFTTNGHAVASLTVACTERVRDGSGGWKDGDTTFVLVTAWKKLAENVAESARKGDRLVVVGQMKQENWETKEGEKRSTMKVVADSVGLALTFATIKTARASGETPADPWEGVAKPEASDDSEPPF